VRLSFFEQELHDFHIQVQRPRQWDAIRCRHAGRGFPNPERVDGPNRHNLSDWRVAIQDRHRLSASDGAQVLT
jgi:hypothetical protein